MPFTSYATDYQLNQWAASKGLYMSLHSAYSLTGGNELAGGSYARVAPTWASAAGGVLSLSGTPYAMNAPASSTVGWIGFWDAATSGNFSGMWPNAATAGWSTSRPWRHVTAATRTGSPSAPWSI